MLQPHIRDDKNIPNANYTNKTYMGLQVTLFVVSNVMPHLIWEWNRIFSSTTGVGFCLIDRGLTWLMLSERCDGVWVYMMCEVYMAHSCIVHTSVSSITRDDGWHSSQSQHQPLQPIQLPCQEQAQICNVIRFVAATSLISRYRIHWMGVHKSLCVLAQLHFHWYGCK